MEMATPWQMFKWLTFFFPVFKVVFIICRIFDLGFMTSDIEWLFAELAEFIINVWMISRIINSPNCTSPSFLGLIRCWLKPIHLSILIIINFFLFHVFLHGWSEGPGWGPIHFEDLWFQLPIMWISWYIYPEFTCIIFVAISARVAVLIVETVADEIIAWKHRHDQPPTILLPADTYWEVVTILKTSNNGYNAEQFYAAAICDFNQYDDPFYPENSLLCVVEVRRHNSIWKTFTIWQVSMLNGGKKKMHEFQYISYKTDGHIFDRRVFWGSWNIKAFQSGGVIFVYFADSPYATIFVYDTRFRKAATYEFEDFGRFHVSSLISMTCTGRFITTDGKVEGWRMHLLKEGEERCTWHQHNGTNRRSVIEAVTYELRETASVTGSQEVSFGQCREFSSVRRLDFVRTSDGSFGLQIVETPIEDNDGPSVIYNSGTGTFAYFSNFQALLRFDRPLASYFYTPSPRDPLREGDGFSGLCPAILSPTESIGCREDGAIFRTRFKPPSMRYRMARQLFHDRPLLRQEMGAEGFRRLTGLDGMEGHFDS